MSEPIAYVDGALLPRADASVSIDDASVRYGAACFETMRAANGRVFRLGAHLERLHRGLEAMGIVLPDAAAFEAAVAATLEANALTEARVRLSVSAGRMPGPDLAAAGTPSVVVVADPVSSALAPPPLDLAVSSVRIHAGRPLAFAKTAQFLGYLLARAEAREAGADDALLLNERGEVCETSAANVFAVLDGGLVTPSLGAGPLPGVTRAVVLEVAAREGLASEERAITLEDLRDAEELFVTNSVVGTEAVRSVASIGSNGPAPDELWSAPAPGPLTSHLGAEYARLLADECGRGERDG